MATKLNSKLLILYSLICGIIFANNAFCADQIVNKSSRFSAMISSNTGDNQSTTSSAIAEQIRAQRAAIDARDNSVITSQQTRGGATSNKCDNDLRKCIESTCGADYNKCATDSDTTFSDKLNACRKNTTCTAREFSVFVNEIKEDKKQEIKFSSYNQTVNCGNRYNDCIITECGTTFNKCLSKSAGDRAIAKCKTIADQCRAADSGITGRAGRVFGIVRTSAEKQIAADEKRLRDMRVQMRKSCESLGAMFDERSLDCVFTVNFFADNKQMASKKLYAGSVFDCTPDWFGIDITTFKENAYRLTRAQTAASSAMLGSGLGTAAGAFTSGAIDRAIDTHKAKNALEAACNKKNQILGDNGKCEECQDGTTFKDGKCVNTFGTNIKNATKKVASIGNSINKSTSGAQRALVSAAAQSEGIPKPVADAAANLGIDARDELFNQGQQLLLGSENM
ncbi:MAG: hypothetical protein ACLRFM_00010 [Alphaproteobacteria bacterium]